MDNNALMIQMLLDRQRDIEALRVRVAELEAQIEALTSAT